MKLEFRMPHQSFKPPPKFTTETLESPSPPQKADAVSKEPQKQLDLAEALKFHHLFLYSFVTLSKEKSLHLVIFGSKEVISKPLPYCIRYMFYSFISSMTTLSMAE